MQAVERALRDYMLENAAITGLIGDAIFIGRTPKDAPATVILLTRQTVLRDYFVNVGEDDCATVLLGLDILSRASGAIGMVFELAEVIRQQFTGFRGELFGVFFASILIDGETYIPSTPRDKSDFWIHDYSLRFRATYQQTAVVRIY